MLYKAVMYKVVLGRLQTTETTKMLNFIEKSFIGLYPVYWLLPFSFLFSLLILFRTLDTKTQKKQLPPGPPRLPFLGNLHQLGELPHRSLRNLTKKYGEVMCLQLGYVPTIIISSAETAKQVLKVHDLECSSRPSSTGTRRLSYNFLDIGFAPYGDYWREMRKICVHELFSVKRVKSFQSIREEEVHSIIKTISQSSVSVVPVDLSKTFYSLTVGITFRIAFGMNFQDKDFEGENLEELVVESETVVASFNASDFFPYVGWVFDRLSGYHRRLEKCFHDLDNFLELRIDEHISRGTASSDQEDIVDVLLKLEKNKHGSHSLQLTKDHIKAVLMNVFLGGVDTSAVIMIWAMTELTRNRRVMTKVQAELRRCLGNKGKVTEADIDQLHYLKMVVKETLRLHPSAPLLVARETIAHVKINNYDIPPGTRVQINGWAIGRDPKSWKNPEEFFPERFMESDIDFKGQHFELLPFGGGRRGCPAIYMATCTIELALASVLYHFDWELPEGMKEIDISMEEKFGLTVHKKSHLYLVPISHHQGSSEDIMN